MSRAGGFSARRPLLLGWIALGLLVLGFGGWAFGTQISGAIVAPGRVVVERNRQVVQHPDSGVVGDLMVSEGDHVAAGAVLLRLEDHELRSRLAVIETRLFEVMARRARLEAERDGATEITFDALLHHRASIEPALAEVMAGQRQLLQARAGSIEREVAQLHKRREQTGKRIEGITAQQAALRQQVALIDQELQDQQALLDRGLAQVARVLSLRREDARLRGAMGELAARRAEAVERSAEIDIEVLKLTSHRREAAIAELRDLRRHEAELSEERRALLARLARLEIKAPVAGVVHDLQVFGPQAVIRPAAPLLYIVPQNRPLAIQARIAPSKVNAVHPGQDVTLRFSFLNQGAEPRVTGQITRLSADVLRDPSTGHAYYRADIILPPEARANLPGDATLLPGMPVDAFIRTQAQRPIAYLLEPLSGYFARAFRE